MPSITIPRLGGGGNRRNRGGENRANQPAPPPPQYPNDWIGAGIPEPPLPSPNPMPVPQVPDLNWWGDYRNNGGQPYGPPGDQPGGWGMRNWYRPDIPWGNDGRTNWMPQRGQEKGYGFSGGGQGGGMGGQNMGGLFEALMRLFQQ